METNNQPVTDPQVGESVASESQSAAVDHERFFLVGIVDFLMDLVRKMLSERLIMQSCRWAALVGMWATVVFAGLSVIFGLISAISQKSIGPLGVGIAVSLLALALLYTAAKFCNAGRAVIDASQSQMSSKAFLDSLALVAAVMAILLVIGGIVAGIASGQMTPVGVGLGIGVGWAYLAAVALNPSLVNVTVQPGTSAGQEFLGILTFFLKAKLRIVPIIFGIVISVCGVLYLIGIFRYFAAEGWGKGAIYLEMSELAGLILIAAALPFVVYITVLMVYLLIDLAQAVLRIK